MKDAFLFLSLSALYVIILKLVISYVLSKFDKMEIVCLKAEKIGYKRKRIVAVNPETEEVIEYLFYGTDDFYQCEKYKILRSKDKTKIINYSQAVKIIIFGFIFFYLMSFKFVILPIIYYL